ncbi:MAG: nuclear transport factor 2 family protein [Sciscionella sp.]
MSNVEVALRLMDEIPSGRFSPELLHPEFTAWTITFGDLEGAAYLGALRRLAAVFSPPLRIEIVGVTDGGERVAIEADSEGTLPDGSTYTNHYHFLFAFTDGRVSQIREYLDTAPIDRIRAAQQAQAAAQGVQAG